MPSICIEATFYLLKWYLNQRRLFLSLFFVDICRVCRSGPSPGKPLFHPCLCTGSIKFVHQDLYVSVLGLVMYSLLEKEGLVNKSELKCTLRNVRNYNCWIVRHQFNLLLGLNSPRRGLIFPNGVCNFLQQGETQPVLMTVLVWLPFVIKAHQNAKQKECARAYRESAVYTSPFTRFSFQLFKGLVPRLSKGVGKNRGKSPLKSCKQLT